LPRRADATPASLASCRIADIQASLAGQNIRLHAMSAEDHIRWQTITHHGLPYQQGIIRQKILSNNVIIINNIEFSITSQPHINTSATNLRQYTRMRLWILTHYATRIILFWLIRQTLNIDYIDINRHSS
jgi:hypothetical protein